MTWKWSKCWIQSCLNLTSIWSRSALHEHRCLPGGSFCIHASDCSVDIKYFVLLVRSEFQLNARAPIFCQTGRHSRCVANCPCRWVHANVCFETCVCFEKNVEMLYYASWRQSTYCRKGLPARVTLSFGRQLCMQIERWHSVTIIIIVCATILMNIQYCTSTIDMHDSRYHYICTCMCVRTYLV